MFLRSYGAYYISQHDSRPCTSCEIDSDARTYLILLPSIYIYRNMCIYNTPIYILYDLNSRMVLSMVSGSSLRDGYGDGVLPLGT